MKSSGETLISRLKFERYLWLIEKYENINDYCLHYLSITGIGIILSKWFLLGFRAENVAVFFFWPDA